MSYTYRPGRALALTLTAAFLPSLLAAQKVTRTAAGGNLACSQLASSPSLLGQSPEGRALLRFSRELGGAAEVIELRGDSNRRVDIQRIAKVQRGVDSLMQIVVTYKRPDGSDVETVTIRRGDSVPRMVYGKLLAPNVAMFEEIEGRIRSLQSQMATVSASPRPRESVRSVSPSGYLGVHLLESKITLASPTGPITNYCDYPVIEAVDADSPAARAGLNAGDTVLAYNGRDVQTVPVNYRELVVSGQTLRVAVKRGGKKREVNVTVGVRDVEPAIVFMQSTCTENLPCMSSFSFSTDGPDSAHVRRMVSGMMPRSSSSRVTVSGATPSPLSSMMPGNAMAVIAGAQLSVLDVDVAQILGVEPGILVLRAPAGSVAAEAGLRGGDVIRSVNGAPVRDLSLLLRAYHAVGARDVKLTVSARNAAARSVVLRAAERE